ncbi:hypothetical protein BDV93DRAFT_564271 [Ceratobasidium sp. AG-I]|nr:hypothetical protein BDV93DRAFT_564271 [Ceratobasidium sp. AG-I]
MARAYTHYLETLFSDDGETGQDLLASLEQPSEAYTARLLEHKSGDLGCEKYANVSIEELYRLLGMVGGAVPFGEEGGPSTKKGEPDKKRFVPRWHQLVALAVALEMFFTSSQHEVPLPLMVCDDVGLGKTIEVLLMICALAHSYELQQMKKPLMPLLQEQGKTFFAGQATMEGLPNLVATQLTLTSQWESQMSRFTMHGGFRVLIYSRRKTRQEFFGKGGLWERALGKNPQRVGGLTWVTARQTIAAEAKECLRLPLPGRAGKLDLLRGEPQELVVKDGHLSIFGQRFQFFAVDEIHSLRNTGHASNGVTRLSANSKVRTGLTATPVFNGCKDLVAQGRILRHAPMIGQQGVTLGLRMESSQRKLAREWKNDPDGIQAEMSRLILRDQGRVGSASNKPPAESTADVQVPVDVSQGIANQTGRGYRNAYVGRESIAMSRAALIGIVLRRTGQSLMPNGQPVLNLRPYIESTAWAPLRNDEKAVLDSLTQMFVDDKDQGLAASIYWKNFLLDYKRGLFHWLLLAQKGSEQVKGKEGKEGKEVEEGEENKVGKENKKKEPTGKFWEPWNIENLSEMASSRILQVCALIDHHKNQAAQPLFFHRDGTRDHEQEVANPCIPAQAPRKFLILIVYEEQRTIMKHVFKIRGEECIEYDGRMSPKAREDAVKQFEERDDLRIMIISSVGTTGLNLTVASIVIFMSGLWSEMEAAQMSGRVWRDGQTEQVVIYRVLCPGSPDELLGGIASGKVIMHKWFVDNELLQKKWFHRENTDSDDDGLLEDDTAEAPRGKGSKVVVRASKTPATGSETRSEVDPMPSAPKSRRQGGKSTVEPVSKPGARPKKRKNPENATEASEAAINGGDLESLASAPKRAKLSSRTSNEPLRPQPSPRTRSQPPSQPNKPTEPEPPVIAELSFEASSGPAYGTLEDDLADIPVAEKRGSVTSATFVQPSAKVDKGKGKERDSTLSTDSGKIAGTPGSPAINSPKNTETIVTHVLDMGQGGDTEGLATPDLNEFVNLDMAASSWSDVPDEHSFDKPDSAAVRVKAAPRPPPFVKNQTPAAKPALASSQVKSSSSTAQVCSGTGLPGPVRHETPRSDSSANPRYGADAAPKAGQPKPPGQLKPPRSMRPAQSTRTLNTRHRLQNSERQDELHQKGLVVPRSPIRGSRNRSTVGEPEGSPPSTPRQTAAFRMASLIHERPGSWFADQRSVINKHLSQMALCGRPRVSFASNLRVPKPNSAGHNTPDQALLLDTYFANDEVHSPARPRIVLETSCSQTLESVMEKAWDFLYSFRNEVHAVIVCNMNCPITTKRDFRVSIGVWIRKPTHVDHDGFPPEVFPYAHESRWRSAKVEMDQEEEDNAALADSSTSISDGGTSATFFSEGNTRVDDLEYNRTYTSPGKEKEIWRRSEKPIEVESAVQDEPGPLEPLVLDAYDILLVCSQHLEGTIDGSEISLPPDELRDWIKITCSGEQPPAELRPAKRRRK